MIASRASIPSCQQLIFALIALFCLANALYGAEASSLDSAGSIVPSDREEYHHVDEVINCDIAIAGGSTASLAAAITAAEAAPEMTVCLTEPTDWPGGQMTSGGVPAIDFGGANKYEANQPKSFRDFMNHVKGNPGACTVSIKCYLPGQLVRTWIMPRIAQSPNLHLLLRTTVSASSKVRANYDSSSSSNASNASNNSNNNDSGSSSGSISSTTSITSLTCVQRTPRPNTTEWSAPLSRELSDWYDPQDSPAFTKKVLQIRAPIFIEATELGDVLATAGIRYTQGVEVPNETSNTSLAHCGQAWTLTFYMSMLRKSAAAKGPVEILAEDVTTPQNLPLPPPPPHGGPAGIPFPSNWTDLAWRHSWYWRRAFCAGNHSSLDPNVGDVTQQNLGNDLDSAYLLKASSSSSSSNPLHNFQQSTDDYTSGGSAEGTGTLWTGGINTTALTMLEQRAYGYYYLMKNNTPRSTGATPSQIILNHTAAGTVHGLSKFPYVRDTRRPFGLDGFRLQYSAFAYHNASRPGTGYHFPDTVALGNYNDDIHHLNANVSGCAYPPYLAVHDTQPYYIPFRALMVGDVPNLLVAGKTMSQTFHAQAATRLHPSEWTSGVAAGGAAVFMLRNKLGTTTQALQQVQQLRAFLNSSAVGQPLDWAPSSVPYVDGQVGFVCAPGYGTQPVCIGADASLANQTGARIWKTASCGGACRALADDQWLANKAYWQRIQQRRHQGKQMEEGWGVEEEEVLSIAPPPPQEKEKKSAPVAVAVAEIAARQRTTLKKTVANSHAFLPPNETMMVEANTKCILLPGAETPRYGYYLCKHG